MDRQYIEITLIGLDDAGKDLAVGLLSSLGYYGFEDRPEAFSAYIDASSFDEGLLQPALDMLGVSWQKKLVREENWNALWEASFDPVVIPGKVAIRAGFHPPVTGVIHEIVITPKMSFGTGHHATTGMMMEMMFDVELKDAKVLDFGAGTGILAILAGKMGAKAVDAIDIDPWCIENMEENISLNDCTCVRVAQSGRLPEGQSYDIILANINRNFLLEHSPGLVSLIRPGGILLLSGFLEEDELDIINAYLPLGTQTLVRLERNKWAALALQYKHTLTT